MEDEEEGHFDRLFRALADPTRRRLLDRLRADNGQTLGALCRDLAITRQGITQHLAGGLPQTVVDPNGVTTLFTYDVRQRLVSSTLNTAAGPLTTRYAYDAAGNRLSVTEAARG